MALPASTVEILRCPQCHSRVVEDGDQLVCTDRDQRLAYPVRDGIPVMVADEASELTLEEWDAVMVRQTKEESV